jgi:hypothetical protein
MRLADKVGLVAPELGFMLHDLYLKAKLRPVDDHTKFQFNLLKNRSIEFILSYYLKTYPTANLETYIPLFNALRNEAFTSFMETYVIKPYQQNKQKKYEDLEQINNVFNARINAYPEDNLDRINEVRAMAFDSFVSFD